MFYTPGWAAIFAAGGIAGASTLAGVVVTQGFNAWSRHIDAKSKREDRRHERALEYGKLAWQAKNDALVRLISACRFVKFRAWLTGTENTDENDRRAATIRALDLFKGRVGDEDGINEVYAYAAEPVCKALEEVLEQVDVQRRKHMDQLSRLRRVGTQMDALDAVMRGPVTDDSGALLAQPREPLQQYADLLHQRGQALDAIGRESDLDVDKVIAL